MRLSPHFTIEEFTRSSKATELGIDNTPNQVIISALESLCDIVLEPIRVHFDRPVKILSGYRCIELNKAVGGAATSQHTLGEAADIEIAGVHNAELWQFIVDTLNYDQCIAERLRRDSPSAGWVHVSHKRFGAQRKEALSFTGSKYVKGLRYV